MQQIVLSVSQVRTEGIDAEELVLELLCDVVEIVELSELEEVVELWVVKEDKEVVELELLIVGDVVDEDVVDVRDDVVKDCVEVLGDKLTYPANNMIRITTTTIPIFATFEIARLNRIFIELNCNISLAASRSGNIYGI